MAGVMKKRRRAVAKDATDTKFNRHHPSARAFHAPQKDRPAKRQMPKRVKP